MIPFIAVIASSKLHFKDRNTFEALSSIQYCEVSVVLKESATLTLLGQDVKLQSIRQDPTGLEKKN